MLVRKLYYWARPYIPRYLQLMFRKRLVKFQLTQSRSIWPINNSAKTSPAFWPGWGEGRKFALILSHDVDTFPGLMKVRPLMQLEQALGVKSVFNFVPERYGPSDEIRSELIGNGFEIGVHGLNHDGRLYESWKVFKERAKQINQYIKDWEVDGFRSPSMHHNLDWIHELNIKYDSSTFDTDPFEPQPDGVDAIFPFWVNAENSDNSYLEIPVTLPQDFTLFVLMGKNNIDIWKDKLDWIAEKGGLAVINVHPDYVNFEGGEYGKEEYPSGYYKEFIEYVKEKYSDECWFALPKDIYKHYLNITVQEGISDFEHCRIDKPQEKKFDRIKVFGTETQNKKQAVVSESQFNKGEVKKKFPRSKVRLTETNFHQRVGYIKRTIVTMFNGSLRPKSKIPVFKK